MNKNTFNKMKKMMKDEVNMNGREDFINSSVIVPLIFINDEYHFLFEKRNINISQGGEICFPGGRLDEYIDIDSKATAIREIEEELGITRDNIEIVGRIDTVFSPVGVIVDGYLAVLKLKSIENLNINKDEVEYTFLVPVSWFEQNKPSQYCVCIKAHPSIINEVGKEEVLLPSRKLNLPQVYSKPWGKGRYKIYLYNYNNEVIWGITARFIMDVISSIKD